MFARLSMKAMFIVTWTGAIATGAILGFVTHWLFDNDSTDEDSSKHEN